MRLSIATGCALALALIAASPIVACGGDDAGSNTPKSLSCPAAQTACTHDGVVTCATLANDPSNCGACGKACATGEVCAGGVCAVTCPEGLTACDGSCRNLDDDPDACGSCTTKCGDANGAAVCASGTCALVCNAGFGDCDGKSENGCEARFSSDPKNCGACNSPCPGMCIDGKCSVKPALEDTFVKTHAGCTHLPPHRNEDVAADRGGVLYAAASCAGGEIEVAASIDGGATWTAPVTVPGFTDVAHLELRGGVGAGTLHVVGATAGGDLVYSRSTDAGATFLATPITIRTGGTSDTSTVVYEGKVFVVAPENGGFPVYVSTDGGDTWSKSLLTTDATAHVGERAAANVSFDGRVLLGGLVGADLYHLIQIVGPFFSGEGTTRPATLTNPAIAASSWTVFGGDGDQLWIRGGSTMSIPLPAALAAPGTRQIVSARTPGVFFVAGQTDATETSLHRFLVNPDETFEIGGAKTLSGTNAHVSAYDDTRAVVSMQVGSDIVTGVVTP